jgi:hypothetical protein
MTIAVIRLIIGIATTKIVNMDTMTVIRGIVTIREVTAISVSNLSANKSVNRNGSNVATRISSASGICVVLV